MMPLNTTNGGLLSQGINLNNGPLLKFNKPAPMLLPTLNFLKDFRGDVNKFLSNVPMFRHLSPQDLNQISQAMEKRDFDDAATIFNQGTKGDAFYVVCAGSAHVMVSASHFIKVGQDVLLTRDVKIAGRVYPRGTECVVDKYDANRGYPFTVRVLATGDRGRVLPEEVELAAIHAADVKIATLFPGDYFGDQALLKGSYRNATIIAGGQLSTCMLTVNKFQQLGISQKLHFAKRKAVLAIHDEEAARVTSQDRDISKNPQQQDIIRNAIMKNKNLHEIHSLTTEDIDAMVRIAYKRHVPRGTNLMKEGEMFGEEFYVVESGQFEFHVSNHKCCENVKMSQMNMMKACQPGESFGELALLHHAPREATVTAATDSLVWVIDRIAFKNLLFETHRNKMLKYIAVFDTIEIFNCLLVNEKQALAENLYQKHFLKGEQIMQEGEEGNMFCILMEGQVNLTKGKNTVKTLQAHKENHKGTYFGETALFKKEPRRQGACAASEDVVVACLSKHDFERLLGPLEEIMLEGLNRGSRIPEIGKYMDSSLQDIKMNQLKRIGLLGCGGFGAVSLEQHINTGKVYAMKQLSKGYIVKTKMQKSVMSEKNILMMCDSNFVIKLYATFKTTNSLYFLLEPAMGGELYATYNKYRFHGNGAKCKFYAASTVYAFEHLHDKHVLYRDLKPENLLLDYQGFCKLTDMGLAKQTVTKTYTTCGTPDYFAPEVIQQSGQNAGVDWWTLGVLIHELMCGHAPFESSNPTQIYQKVLRGVQAVNFPYQRNEPAAVDLVKGLLVRNPNERLPMLAGGLNNLKNHVFFNGFDWNAHWEGKVKPPYTPQVKGPTDISNFRAKESDIPPQLPYKEDGTNWDANF